MSSSMTSSQRSSFSRFDKGDTVKLYRNIKKTLQEVQEIASEVNANYKVLQDDMTYAAQLITAIQTRDRTVADVTTE